MSTFTPSLIFPKTFSAGTQHSVKTNSEVLEPRIPNLSSFCADLNPDMAFSTIKAVMHLAPADLSVLAYTTTTSASGPLVIHIFEPFNMNSSPFCSAYNCIPTTSEPALGSLIASAPTHSPFVNLGKYFNFCSCEAFKEI